jgi:hypothetical protein
MPGQTTHFMFSLAEDHMPALAGAALRLHGPFGQAITHACASAQDDEPTHVAVIRADVSVGRDVLERAERLRSELAVEAGVPVDAVGVYAVCCPGPSRKARRRAGRRTTCRAARAG